MISEAAQETLEELWVESVEGCREWLEIARIAAWEGVAELMKSDCIVKSDESVCLSKLGRREAQKIIRRHRLAERLLHDVLEVGGEDMETTACGFEHYLPEGVEESICTLLGHPAECPHGKAIPPGNCCREGKNTAESVVLPLSRLKNGQRGSVVYLLTRKQAGLTRLMAMGILPGQTIEVIYTYPSYVFQLGQTQVAVDEENAGDIFVRLM